MLANNSGVYEYNRGSYDPYHTSPSQPQPQPFIVQDPKFPIPAESDPNFKRTDFSNKNTRHDDYSKRRGGDYKYNIFSIIDEPWNRCCELGRCGNCPGNECVSSRTPKLDWL